MERGEGREKEWERNINVQLSLACPPWGPGLQPRHVPDWESNRRPFGSHASTQSTEPHQLGLPTIFKSGDSSSHLNYFKFPLGSRSAYLLQKTVEFHCRVTGFLVRLLALVFCFVLWMPSIKSLISLFILKVVPCLLILLNKVGIFCRRKLPDYIFLMLALLCNLQMSLTKPSTYR